MMKKIFLLLIFAINLTFFNQNLPLPYPVPDAFTYPFPSYSVDYFFENPYGISNKIEALTIQVPDEPLLNGFRRLQCTRKMLDRSTPDFQDLITEIFFEQGRGKTFCEIDMEGAIAHENLSHQIYLKIENATRPWYRVLIAHRFAFSPLVNNQPGFKSKMLTESRKNLSNLKVIFKRMIPTEQIDPNQKYNLVYTVLPIHEKPSNHVSQEDYRTSLLPQNLIKDISGKELQKNVFVTSFNLNPSIFKTLKKGEKFTIYAYIFNQNQSFQEGINKTIAIENISLDLID